MEQKVTVSADGAITVTTKDAEVTLTAQAADEIFRAVLARNAAEDALSLAEDEDIALSEEEAAEAGILYAQGAYDCSLDYWSNIRGAVRRAKGVAA